MNIVFNRYNEPIQGHVYLGTPNGKILCAINGIEESTFQLTSKFNNTFELTFDLNENILIQDGKGLSKLVHSNVYDLVGWLMRVYVENVGWFIMEHPKITDDGMKQIKTITCQSAEIEMQQHDLKNFKINQGTTDSYEMLADNNVEKIDDVEFAKEQIKFHNPKNPQLSLIDLALKAAGMKGWSVGEIDSTPKTYRTYKDGKYVETTTLLSNEIGAFDVESQDLYSFFTQDMAKYFQCVFVFDFLHMKISAYHPENYGKSTNVNINFRNLQQSQEITVDDSTLFTRYYVQGADDLGITYVNFGSNYIENINYYLNEKYFSPLLIIKYKLWKEDYEEARILYIEATRQYNEQMKVVTELYDRVPLDDCSTDWSTFTDDELKEAQANYQAQLKGYEQFYVDDDGNFDETALKNSSDANDYYQIKDVILPSIQIEMDNRQLPTDDDNADYVDSYKTNWKLYGLDELKVKLQEYKNTIEICKKGGYNQPYTEDSSHTKDVHDTMYAKYLDAQNQLDSNYVGGCQEAYDQRQSEIDAANEILNSYNKTRTDLVKQISKETWSGVVAADNSGYILDEDGNYITDEAGRRIYCDTQKLQFTERDLTELSKVYYDGDYSNENMFLTDSDDQVSAIDEQLKLLDTAIDDLYIASHPQYQFTTSLDNFLALADYEDYIKNINQGDYLWLTVDNKVVKLRVVEIQYNPLIADNSIQITFSNMIQGRSSRNDLSYVLNTPSNASKSSASGSSNNFLNNEGITLTAGLIQKLISNGSFKNGVSQIINNEFAGMLAGSSISLEELNAKIIKVTDLYGKNGYFEYLQSKLITAGKIVSDSADFKELSTLAATIKSAIIGASSTETGIVINLTTENATMSEAMIKDLIAKYITVNELKAGDIYTNKIKILSEDGTLKIQDNTFTIYNKDGNPVVQLGEDKNGNYGLIISDSKGSVLLDSQGLHEGIVPDDFIKTDMIADGQITESKIDKTTMRDWTMPDGSKVFDVSHLWDGDDSFGKSYNTIKSTVSATSKELGDLSDKVDQLGNGYTVVLSNETQNIPCTSDGITATSFLIEIPFYAYEGIKQAACTVVVGELPAGITLAENTAATSTAPGKITLNVAKGKTLGNKSLLTGTIVFTCTVSGKKISKKFTWIKSLAGKDGKTPVKGVDYFDGVSSYVWIRYATDAKGTGMTAIPSTTTGYIGTATTTTAVAPTNASAYVWAKYIGEKGAKGDGGYIHIAYANSADGKTGFDTTIGTGKSYIGQYTDNIEDDSTNPSKYTWSLIKGADGKTLYTWLKYADSPTSGMSDSPAGKTYMGIAVNKTSITESSNYSDYTWSLIKGTDGISVKGDKGDTVYIWVKYADDAKGNGMSEYPDGKKYIGLAYNKTTATESNNASDYIWSLIQGEDAVLYEIEPSVAVIKKCTLDVCSITDESGNRIVDEQGRFLSGYFLTDSLSPNKITFTAYKQVGSKTRATYACRFIIQESLNGLSWSTKYTSSKDETSVSYTPSTLKLQQIKCVMYRAGGITEQLDSQTVPVIQDAEGYDSVIQTFTDTFASVELKVDNNTKAITLKAEQKDITNAINNYDNTTVKDIRNRQTEQKVNIDGISTKVSDIETTINGSVDGTKTGLIEKVTQVTTKAGTIEANLKNNYTTTAGMNTQISNSIAASADKIKVTLADGKTESTLKAALGEIQKSVKDNAGNISTVTQKANSIETKVANQGNDIVNLKVDAKAVETLVGSSAGTTDVVQKATDFRKTITDAAGNANLALSTANSNKNIISNMKVGAANTIRNSNDLIYDLYFMVASLRDESGNRIVAENGDYLVAYY
nr:MAG: Prophage endopeptidase tail [Bacteriophage sp.]